MVWESSQTFTHFINLALFQFPDAGRQFIERFGKRSRRDLKRRRHSLLGLANCIMAFRNLLPGLIQFGLYCIGQFEFVFQNVINYRTEFFDLGAG